MEAIVKRSTSQDQQAAHESLPLFTEIAQNEFTKADLKDHLQFLAQQAQELNMGYE